MVSNVGILSERTGLHPSSEAQVRWIHWILWIPEGKNVWEGVTADRVCSSLPTLWKFITSVQGILWLKMGWVLHSRSCKMLRQGSSAWWRGGVSYRLSTLIQNDSLKLILTYAEWWHAADQGLVFLDTLRFVWWNYALAQENSPQLLRTTSTRETLSSPHGAFESPCKVILIR